MALMGHHTAEKFETRKKLSPSSFKALFTGKILVLYEKNEAASILTIQV